MPSRIDNHAELAARDFPEHQRDAANVVGSGNLARLLRAAVGMLPDRRLQGIETTLFDLFSRALATATGAQLDGYGSLLGLPRTSPVDDTYRAALRVQAGINRSSGTPDELIWIAAFLGDEPSFRDTPPAAAVLSWINQAPSAGDVALLRSAAPAGVRLLPVAGSTAWPFRHGASALGDGTVLPETVPRPAGGGFDVAFAVSGATAATRTFTISGDVTSFFGAGVTFVVVGSVANDGAYTVASSSFAAGTTSIVVVEALPADGGGGQVERRTEPGTPDLTDPGALLVAFP